MSECDVLIVGAGPVGLLSGLLLVHQGLKVIIVDRELGISQSPRALVYHPPTLSTLEEAGILEDVRNAGRPATGGIAWRKASDHSVLAAMNGDALRPEDKPEERYRTPILLGQHKVAEIVLKKLEEKGGQILFGHAFETLEQKDSKVYVSTVDQEGTKHSFTTSFIVGADGGHSHVRSAIDIHLDGCTHPLHMVSVNLRYSKMLETGFGDAQFCIDPQANIEDSAFSVIIHTGTDDVWRCAYVDSEQFSEDEIKARVSTKLKLILPLHPDESEYEIIQATPYRVHQRCASSYTKGRVLLAGDAAHLNNPVGGFGLNTGLLDAPVLARAINDAIKMTEETAVAERLNKYSDTRRAAFLEFVNPTTIDNLRRGIEVSEEADVKLRGEFFEQLQDPSFQREVQLAVNKMALGAPGV